MSVDVGADIDAVGAISTTIIPVPAAAWLMGSALGILGFWGRKKKMGAHA
ncbi:MAG: hypothetical protein QNJ73_01590 [Gammaproteobacteria bacterium]|nr:hypothetical protein [Gammaproteobacteria bacterium]